MCHPIAEAAFDLAAPPGFDVAFEDTIDFFQRLTFGFGKHEEYVNAHDGAENSEHDIGFPRDIGEGRSDKKGKSKVELQDVSIVAGFSIKILTIQLVAAERPTPFARHLRGKTSEQ